jgi:serine/threonine-protein kinase
VKGSAIGPYRITEKIGEGGMGTVWVGEHTLLGRRAAIKMLLPEYTSRDEIVQRFFNEARAVTAISDPGIVQVFDFGHALGSAYIVMELLEGEPMDARMRRLGRFAPVDAIRLFAQIATSLGAAHAKGVIHRDLKPENIFIVGDPAVTGGERTKILDFGIAKLAGDDSSGVKTRTGMVMGTPVYMSPEQCRGASGIDARSDIYSLGCVLFAMVCGRPPFESDATGDLIIMHVRDTPPVASSIVPGLPPALDAVIARCLEKDPARRFQSTAELVQALAAAEAVLFAYRQNPAPAPPDALTRLATPSSATPTTLSSATGARATGPGNRTPRRSGLIVGGLAFAALAIGGGAFVVSTGGSDRGPSPAPAAAREPRHAAAATPDAQTDAQIDATPEPPVADAGVPDAAVSAPVVTATKTKRIDTKRDKRTSPKKGSNASSSPGGFVDRGD